VLPPTEQRLPEALPPPVVAPPKTTTSPPPPPATGKVSRPRPRSCWCYDWDSVHRRMQRSTCEPRCCSNSSR